VGAFCKKTRAFS